MVRSGEANALVSERVWRELERALATDHPERALQVLRDCDALPVLLPELARGAGLPAALDALHRATAITTVQGQPDTAARWAALLADLPPTAVEALCERLRVPAEHRDLAVLAARLCEWLRAGGRDSAQLVAAPEALLQLLEHADAWRRPERFGRWLEVWCARASAESHALTAVDQFAARLAAAQQATAAVHLDDAELAARRGPDIAALLHERRLAVLRAL